MGMFSRFKDVLRDAFVPALLGVLLFSLWLSPPVFYKRPEDRDALRTQFERYMQEMAKLQDVAQSAVRVVNRPLVASIDPGAGQPVGAALDAFLQRAPPGYVVFNTPSSMNIEDVQDIQLTLTLDRNKIDELKAALEQPNDAEVTDVLVADTMQAELKGENDNFVIDVIKPEIQPVSATQTTEWRWRIKPKKSGRQNLYLTVSLLFAIDGSSRPARSVTLDREIVIEVTLAQKAARFTGEYWQFLLTGLLIPVAGYLWRKFRPAKPTEWIPFRKRISGRGNNRPKR